MRLNPVSYTHLDVYKRQAYGFKFLYADELTKDLVIQSLNEWNNQGFSEWPSYAFSNHDAPRAISRWAKAVSYTHLDVYKRQS